MKHSTKPQTDAAGPHGSCCTPENREPVQGWRQLRAFFPTTNRRTFVTALAAVAALAPGRLLAAVRELAQCGPSEGPPPKPAQASGAEGVPPLPLPATPQRRSEKKNPPRPPVIAVKIKTPSLHDWGTDLNDINNLLIWMKASLSVNFTYDEKFLQQINLEAAEVPVLYRTGHHAFTFTDQERKRLRQYLLRGGMMIFDACCGRPEFADSARAEIAAILPEHKLKPIGADHPIFNCYYQNAGVVHFTPISNLPSPGPSGIEGVELSCRMAVVFSPHDLSCGWDMHTHKIAGNTYIESDDGLKIGANLMAYATATRDMSVSLAAAKGYTDAEPTKTDKFRVGQIIHEGDWNPEPVGLRNLLDTVGQTTALKISFATESVRVESDKLSQFPFLYMTGHEDFVWSQAQVAALRQYLANGGFLLADACCGRQKFDNAFRREMAKVFQGEGGNAAAALQVIPPNHPLYQIQNKIKAVRYSDAAEARYKGQIGDQPRLEGVSLNGRLAVVYSPQSLNVGWRIRPVPYAVALAPKSALDLGVNVVMYALAQ